MLSVPACKNICIVNLSNAFFTVLLALSTIALDKA